MKMRKKKEKAEYYKYIYDNVTTKINSNLQTNKNYIKDSEFSLLLEEGSLIIRVVDGDNLHNHNYRFLKALMTINSYLTNE
jgi:sulfatase maturation enzyme AslB (radical SAM superfamily)